MLKGLFILARGGQCNPVWQYVIKTLSQGEPDWAVDCLDYCYGPGLEEGIHSSPALISALGAEGYYILFARMLSYPAGQKPDRNIVTREDFCLSNAISCVIVSDADYFEIYSKDEALLDLLFAALPRQYVEQIEWTDDLTDGRTEFLV